MREIKFRAWDKNTKVMIDFGSLKDFGYWIHKWYRPKRYILVQHTGLKDKNGKEIYEGDIISNSMGKYPIYYNEEHCQFKAKGYRVNSQDIPWDFTEEPYLIEIIGNIHENPELAE